MRFSLSSLVASFALCGLPVARGASTSKFQVQVRRAEAFVAGTFESSRVMEPLPALLLAYLACRASMTSILEQLLP